MLVLQLKREERKDIKKKKQKHKKERENGKG